MTLFSEVPDATEASVSNYVLGLQDSTGPGTGITRKLTVQQVINLPGSLQYLPFSGGTLTGALTLAGDPTSGMEAATKQYVDALAVAPGGSTGNVQFNNGGQFGGLTDAQLTAKIGTFTPTLSGAVPASGGGTAKFLRADGTFAPPPSLGTAGGDLAGMYPNPTVAAIGGVPFALAGSSLAFTTTAPTSLTLPSSGTLLTTADAVTGTGPLVRASSPALSGAPTAPTATLGTNSTQIATTAFVSAIAGTATGQIPATATNDSAGAGKVGEYVESEVFSGSQVPLTNAVISNITSISLSPGDWDVWGIVVFSPNAAASIGNLQGWINTASATPPGEPSKGARVDLTLPFTTASQQIPVGQRRVSIAATTTVYLSAFALFTSTMSAYGGIYARRAR